MFSSTRSTQVVTVALYILGVLVCSQNAVATETQVAKGRTLAETNCGHCHNVYKAGESPLQTAPPFRSLHNLYPVEYLAEALAEGIVTGHPDMPQFSFDPDQVDALISYLKSLE